MKKNTLNKHNKVVIVCKESGLVSLSYNVLLTTPEANIVTKLVTLVVIVKSHQLVPIMVKQVTCLRHVITRK